MNSADQSATMKAIYLRWPNVSMEDFLRAEKTACKEYIRFMHGNTIVNNDIQHSYEAFACFMTGYIACELEILNAMREPAQEVN